MRIVASSLAVVSFSLFLGCDGQVNLIGISDHAVQQGN